MNSLTLPQGILGINVHPTPALPDGAATWSGSRTLLVVDDIRTWLPVGDVAEMTATVSRWTEDVLAAVAGAGPERTVLALHPGPVTSGEELVTLAAGLREQYADPGVAPQPAPTTALARRFDEILGAQFTEGSGPSGVTKAWGRTDVVTAFERATAAVPGMSPADAAAVRAATLEALTRLHGVMTVVGQRDVLLWPVPVGDAGRLPIELTIGAIVDALRGPLERRPRPYPGAAEIDRLELELLSKQRELEARQQAQRGSQGQRGPQGAGR